MTQIPMTPLIKPFFNNTNFVLQDVKEAISTIFVVGFPKDMQEREFQNMFIFCSGFEAATLKIPWKDIIEDDNKKQIIGFAKFHTRKEAMDARDILNGRKVDSEKGCLLKAEMAKKNLHTKRGLLNDQTKPSLESSTDMIPYELKSPIDYYHPDPTPSRDTKPASQLTFRAMRSLLLNHPSRLVRLQDDNLHEPFISRSHHPSTTSSSSSSLPGLISPTSSLFIGSTNPADHNPPCNTLYVGNLPSQTAEAELRTLFAGCVGYRRLSFKTKSSGPMCFVEFDETQFATLALQDLQGTFLSHSTKGGIRLSFSKNPLGVRQNNPTFPLMNSFNHKRDTITTLSFNSQCF